MAWFNWFSRSKAVKRPPDTSGLLHMDRTRPVHPDRGQKAWVDPPHAGNRKSERIERRELLYAVVRDTMVRVGVLSSSYKFKVLSLDQRGRQFLVMMDISPAVGADNARLSEIEVMLAQTAKGRHDILITAVYWRLNEHVSVGLSSPRPAPRPAPPAAAPRFEPIEADEVAAFRQALASATRPHAPPPPGKPVHSGPRHAAPVRHDDESDDSRPQALSNTQYGDLN